MHSEALLLPTPSLELKLRAHLPSPSLTCRSLHSLVVPLWVFPQLNQFSACALSQACTLSPFYILHHFISCASLPLDSGKPAHIYVLTVLSLYWFSYFHHLFSSCQTVYIALLVNTYFLLLDSAFLLILLLIFPSTLGSPIAQVPQEILGSSCLS